MASLESILAVSSTKYENEKLLAPLLTRYRHMGYPEEEWRKISAILLSSRSKFEGVLALERTHGQPAIFHMDEERFLVGDWAVQSPRTGYVYDDQALSDMRKREKRTPWINRFQGDNIQRFLAANPHLKITNRNIYSLLLKAAPDIDSISSSFIDTPDEIRKEGKVCIASGGKIETVEALSHDSLRGFRCFVEFPFQ